MMAWYFEKNEATLTLKKLSCRRVAAAPAGSFDRAPARFGNVAADLRQRVLRVVSGGPELAVDRRDVRRRPRQCTGTVVGVARLSTPSHPDVV